MEKVVGHGPPAPQFRRPCIHVVHAMISIPSEAYIRWIPSIYSTEKSSGLYIVSAHNTYSFHTFTTDFSYIPC